MLPHLLGAIPIVLLFLAPSAALDIQSTTVPGRQMPTLGNGEIAINRADRNLYFKAPDGSVGIGALLNALPAGRKAVEQEDASDLRVRIGTGFRSLAERMSETVHVLDYGVKCDGVTDDAPALRTLFQDATGKRIVFPSGQTCRSASFVSPGYPGNQAAIFITGQSDFHVDARGVTFSSGVSPQPTSAVHMDRSSRWSWIGGRFVGNRAGLVPAHENAAFAITSNVDWRAADFSLTGYGGTGAGFVGGWNVNGRIEGVRMDGVGLGFDLAWAKNLVIDRVTAVGADHAGLTSAGHVGAKFFSNVEDRTISGGFNYTGVNFDDTDGVTITNSDVSNFTTGVYLASGKNYRIAGNHFHDNPGFATAKGVGIYVDYVTNVTYTSEGYPVSNVTVTGNTFRNNGSAVPGFAVLLSGSSVKSPDVISGITIDANVFDNNASTAIFTDTPASFSNVFVGPTNLFKGAAQTTRMNAATTTLAGPFQMDASGNMILRSPSSADVGIVVRSGAQGWAGRVSGANGNFYLLDERNSRVPLVINPASPDSSLVIGPSNVSLAKPLTLPASTVAALPSCSSGLRGSNAYVTDNSGIPARGGSVTGGGSTVWPVFCNGASWVAQ